MCTRIPSVDMYAFCVASLINLLLLWVYNLHFIKHVTSVPVQNN